MAVANAATPFRYSALAFSVERYRPLVLASYRIEAVANAAKVSQGLFYCQVLFVTLDVLPIMTQARFFLPR